MLLCNSNEIPCVRTSFSQMETVQFNWLKLSLLFLMLWSSLGLFVNDVERCLVYILFADMLKQLVLYIAIICIQFAQGHTALTSVYILSNIPRTSITSLGVSSVAELLQKQTSPALHQRCVTVAAKAFGWLPLHCLCLNHSTG